MKMKDFQENETILAKMNVGDHITHGDVVIEKVAKKGSGVQEREAILAHGEATGHCHKVFGDDVQVLNDSGKKHLHLVTEAFLKHQEHNKVKLPPGDFAITIQREYDHFSEREREIAD